MIVSVITSSDKSQSEVPIVISLFKAGLPVLHLRKTKFSTKKLKEYIEMIPKEYHSRIIIHSHHKLALKYKLKGIHFTRTHIKQKNKCRLKRLWYRLRRPGITITRSFHHLESLESNRIRYSYVFLNPFFSKTEPHKNHFDISIEFLNKMMKNYRCPVYASGNINTNNLSELKKYALSGVAVSKIIWENPKEAVQKYQELTDLLGSETNR